MTRFRTLRRREERRERQFGWVVNGYRCPACQMSALRKETRQKFDVLRGHLKIGVGGGGGGASRGEEQHAMKEAHLKK